jgi:simple sugar transport system ATP-binding protein
VGVIGLQGSGADQFIRDIFEKKIDIQKFHNNQVANIPKNDIYYTPSDRLERGLFGELSMNEHVALASVGNKLIRWASINNNSNELIDEYEIKGNPYILANQLSGGNQQKLQLALIPKRPGLLLLEQPTRGLDVKSTGSVWGKITERSRSDILVIFSTTDIDEVWKQSDWIICFSGKKITNISKKNSLKKNELKFLISGLDSKK